MGQYIFVTAYETFAFSLAAENSSRLSSMQVAEKNIDERLDELQAMYRKERQAVITDELNDIIPGFRKSRWESSAFQLGDESLVWVQNLPYDL